MREFPLVCEVFHFGVIKIDVFEKEFVHLTAVSFDPQAGAVNLVPMISVRHKSHVYFRHIVFQMFLTWKDYNLFTAKY